MEDWLYYPLSIGVCLVLSLLFSSLRPATGKPTAAPPGPCPAVLSVIGPLLFLCRTSNFGIEAVIRAARSRYGPIFTLYLLPSRPAIFVADHAAAHRVLVQPGAAFAGRPPATLATRIFSSNQHNITSGAYGPLWRVLRHNLTCKILHPSCLRRYADARRLAVAGLVADISPQMGSGGVVVLEGLLHRAMLQLLVSMCFGEGIDEATVASVEALQREFVTSVVDFQVFGVWPAVTKLVFRRRWKKMLSLRRRQEELFVPMIRARRARRDAGSGSVDLDTYVDSLLGLRIPDGGGGRHLTESETVSLCSEFLTAGPDSTAAVAQWIMANLVAQPEIQARLRAEIHDVAGGAGAGIEEDHLPRMPYLRAVVLEGLRRHPPGHFLLPHAATDTTDGGGATLEGFRVPGRASVNVTVAGLALDEAVWPDARRFRPERFLPGGEGADVDLTCGKEIKMIPFGAGRRICPGMALALLHLEYFVANLVAEFEWRAVAGETVDFAEKQELSVVMRRPLRASVVRCAQGRGTTT